MLRIFSLIAALAGFVAPAQAALPTYGFASTAVGVVSPSSAGTATDFSGSGSVDASKWTTQNLNNSNPSRLNSFSFTAAGSGPGVSVADLDLRARSANATSPNIAQFEVFYNVGITSTGVSGTSLGVKDLASTFADFNYDFGVNLLAGETIHFTILSSRNGSYTGSAFYDTITLGGAPIPEPTSMAVFGLLSAGIAARRIRRKA